MDWMKTARIIFAVTMIAVGGFGLITGSFGAIWLPVSKAVPDQQILIYLTSFVTLASGGGMLLKRTAAPAALVLLILLIIWTLLFKGPPIVRDPLVEGVYQSIGENAVLIAATWVLFACAAKGERLGLRIAYPAYGLALIAFGLSHFFYLELTAPLVPNWLPAHVFWAYLTGAIYVVTGISLVVGMFAPVAALLVSVQIALLTFLVWGPKVLAGHLSDFNRDETILSWALTAAAWVIAASFSRDRWFTRPASGGFALRRFARG